MNLLVDRFIDVRFLIVIIVHDSTFVYSVAVSGHCFFSNQVHCFDRLPASTGRKERQLTRKVSKALRDNRFLFMLRKTGKYKLLTSNL